MQPVHGVDVLRQEFVIVAPCDLEAEPKLTPIIIDVFNRLGYLQRLLHVLRRAGPLRSASGVRATGG